MLTDHRKGHMPSSLCQLCRPRPCSVRQHGLPGPTVPTLEAVYNGRPPYSADSLRPRSCTAALPFSVFTPCQTTPNVVLCLLVYLNMNILDTKVFSCSIEFWSDYVPKRWPLCHLHQTENGRFIMNATEGQTLRSLKKGVKTKPKHPTVLVAVNICLCSKHCSGCTSPQPSQVSADTGVRRNLRSGRRMLKHSYFQCAQQAQVAQKVRPSVSPSAVSPSFPTDTILSLL